MKSLQLSSKTLPFGQLAELASAVPASLPKLKVAVMGDASTQWLVIALKGYACAHGLSFEIYEAGFDQIDSEIMNPDSGLFSSEPDYVIVTETSRRLLQKYRAVELAQRMYFAQERLAVLERRIARLRAKLNSRLIWFDCECFSDGVYGSFGANVRGSFEAQLVAYNAGLWQQLSSREDVFLFRYGHLAAQHGTSAVFDSRLYYMAEAAYGLEFVPVVARELVEMIATLEGALRKCLILDLDNTLWGGTVGDLGAEGVEIGNLGVGRAFEDMQTWALELKNRGVILVVCSKNAEENARRPFLERPEMKLKLDDIAFFVANWEPKHENILFIQKSLNIGLDSMVFVDDNPLERDSVRHFLPEVLVPELPADPEEYVDFLSSLNLFSIAQVTQEDAGRTELYQAEQKRQSFQVECSSFDDYLASLEMEVQFEAMTEVSRQRLVQLFARSNQFNVRTIRYSDSDLSEMLESKERSVYSCQLRDKFGEQGIVSAVVFEWRQDEVFIENWVMSCRVFNRQLEHFLANRFVELARARGKQRLVGERLPTKKNRVIENLFRDLGYLQCDDLWILEVNEANPHSHHLREHEW